MSISIYIHIPFCLKKCDYCDFKSTSPETIPEKEYTDCVIKEMRNITGTLYDERARVKSIYFGGGTPSLFGADSIGRMLAAVDELYDIEKGAEVTLEVNPKTADYERLVAFKGAGINRLSIGTQSFDDNLLKIIGRVHSRDDSLTMYKNARRAGFNNINLDLIFGIPTQTQEMLYTDLNILTELDPEHISAYILTVERATPLFDRIKSGTLRVDDDLVTKMFKSVEHRLSERGYLHYEVSAYAKDGLRSVQNSNYWRSGEYIGFGSAAHSMVKGSRATKLCESVAATEAVGAVRWYNLGEYEEYMARVKADGKGVKAAAVLSEQQRMTEFLIMGMRLLDGIRLDDFMDEFGVELTELYDDKISALKNAKLIEIKNNLLKLTPKGVLLSNEVLLTLI